MLMWLCAAAGSAWLLQFIEDMQQSRAFHKTCELKLTKRQAAKIPEVRSSYWHTCSVMLPVVAAIVPVVSVLLVVGSC